MKSYIIYKISHIYVNVKSYSKEFKIQEPEIGKTAVHRTKKDIYHESTQYKKTTQYKKLHSTTNLRFIKNLHKTPTANAPHHLNDSLLYFSQQFIPPKKIHLFSISPKSAAFPKSPLKKLCPLLSFCRRVCYTDYKYISAAKDGHIDIS